MAHVEIYLAHSLNMFPRSKRLDQVWRIRDQIMIYGSIFLLLSGLIGNFLNILVFTTLRTFHKKPCSFCIFIESIANFGQILLKLLSYVLGKSFQIYASTNSPMWCKLESVAQQTLNLISFGAICIAALDQFLATNPRSNFQQKSSLRTIQQCLIIYTTFALAHSIPLLIFFDINPNMGCVVENLILAKYHIFFYYPVLIGLLPISLMITLSFAAFYNLRHLIQHNISGLRRRMLRQCTSMILGRVSVFVILTLPYVIERTYSLYLALETVSSQFISTKHLISVIIGLWFFLNYVVIQY